MDFSLRAMSLPLTFNLFTGNALRLRNVLGKNAVIVAADAAANPNTTTHKLSNIFRVGLSILTSCIS